MGVRGENGGGKKKHSEVEAKGERDRKGYRMKGRRSVDDRYEGRWR